MQTTIQPTTFRDPKETLDLGILTEMIGYQLRRAQMRVYNSFNKHLESLKITPSQMGLLLKIKNNPGISQTVLAKANGIERSTLGEIIERFEKRGLIERERHQRDRRAYALNLSERGRSYLDSVIPAVEEHEAQMLVGWTDEEKQTLLELLAKLAEQDA